MLYAFQNSLSIRYEAFCIWSFSWKWGQILPSQHLASCGSLGATGASGASVSKVHSWDETGSLTTWWGCYCYWAVMLLFYLFGIPYPTNMSAKDKKTNKCKTNLIIIINYPITKKRIVVAWVCRGVIQICWLHPKALPLDELSQCWDIGQGECKASLWTNEMARQWGRPSAQTGRTPRRNLHTCRSWLDHDLFVKTGKRLIKK